MGITRAQQAKQMLQNGGRIGLRGGGADMSTVSAADIGIGTSTDKREYSPSEKAEQRATQKLNERIEQNRQERERQRLKKELLMTPIGRNKPLGPLSLFNANFQRNMNIKLAKKRADDLYSRLENYVVGDTDMDYDFSGAPVGLANLTSNKGTSLESTRPNLYTVNPKASISALQTLLNATRPDTQVTLQNTLNKARDYTSLVNDAKNMTNQEIKDTLTELQNRGKTPDQINPVRDNDGSEPLLPIIPKTITRENDDADADEKENVGRMFRLLADGGMTEDAPVGGIMDIESGRQMYGLGKLVKKATRAVKKIVKSPIGKAALIGGLAYIGGGGGNPFTAAGRGKFSFSNLFSLTKNPLISKGGEFSPMRAIGLASLTPLLFNQQEEDDEEDIDRGPPLEIDRIRANPYLFTPRRFAAEGGSMKEPVAKKTMPLIDMDGKEKDYRETGGFVDMGRMERADDVPARLSKNEFVFTADAVRNAGDGSVDKGAEVMYNMMKNLEAGGDVSEESQGLDGARKMFQTSQRLGEVL